jgi:predicted esterase
VATKPPVSLIHGDRDEILRVASPHQAAASLKMLGLDVASHVSPGLGHSIDGPGLTLGGRFLVERLGWDRTKTTFPCLHRRRLIGYHADLPRPTR